MKLIEKGFIKRNKDMLIIITCLFVLSMFVGLIMGYISVGGNVGQISQAFANLPKEQIPHYTDTGLSSLDFFTHNFTVDVITLVGGLLFSVISVIVFVFNAISIGAPFGSDFAFACTSIIPHGIFEYSASILALAAAFIITKIEIRIIRNRNFKNTLTESKTELKDMLVFIIMSIILLIIAAVIEANITTLVIQLVYGL